ncbi:class I SAM-dependent RNA methyltransferase [Thermodesulfobium sp.]
MDVKPVRFEKVVSSGKTLGKISGKVVFCYGVLPKEIAEVKFVNEKKDYIEAELVSVIKPSKFRIPPKESHYLNCSPWQTINYDYQLELKKSITEEAIFQTVKRDIKLDFFYRANSIYGYRTKIEYKLEDSDKNLRYAFYKRGSKELVPLERGCALIEDKVNRVAYKLLDFINSLNIDKKVFDRFIFRKGKNGEVLGIIYLNCKIDKIILPKVENLVGLVVIAGDDKQIYGREFIEQDLLGAQIRYGYDCFFQNNIDLFSKVLEIVRSEINGARKIVDLYSGVGSIGLSLRDLADKIVLVESFRNSYLYSLKNIKALGARNALSILSESERVSEDVLKESDVIILDPPRAGVGKMLLEKILKALPGKIVYLSCNPITLGRDLSILLKRYTIKKIYGFDFYPNTVHTETLVFLER